MLCDFSVLPKAQWTAPLVGCRLTCPMLYEVWCAAPVRALTSVHMPIVRGSIAAALLVIFVDCVKGMPATLMLRDIQFQQTVQTRLRAGFAGTSG
ncbi:MAG: hypothetical protein U5N55_06945 [Cypionkella sp.]|nr:hypothetical protein [Cypionkella sp.]